MKKQTVRWDHALGSETGQCTDHVPLPTLSQEAVTQRVFFILPASPCALTLFIFVSSSSFSYSERLPRIATRRHPTPPAFPLTPIATTSPAPPSPSLPASTPPQHAPNRHPLTPFCSTPPHPCIPFAPPFVLPSFHCVSALPRCQRHQYPPRRRCLAMRTKDTKPLENCHV